MTEPRYIVIESKVWIHDQTGQKVSPYGAVPWQSPSEEKHWHLTPQGWTIQDTIANTIGCGRSPWKNRDAAEQQARIWNDEYAGRLNKTRPMIGEQLR